MLPLHKGAFVLQKSAPLPKGSFYSAFIIPNSALNQLPFLPPESRFTVLISSSVISSLLIRHSQLP